MSPSSLPQVPENRAAADESQPSRAVESTQPPASQAMDPQQPHAESQNTLGLRGGDRSEMCPGRFCFCVPCPIPCDFCII